MGVTHVGHADHITQAVKERGLMSIGTSVRSVYGPEWGVGVIVLIDPHSSLLPYKVKFSSGECWCSKAEVEKVE